MNNVEQLSKDYLAHYGILGMKWGKRKSRTSGRAKSSKKKRAKKVDPVKNMSDYDLRQKINRIQMEKQYRQLTKKEVSPGRKFVQDVLVGAAKQTATNYTATYMSKGVEKLLGVKIEKKKKK